jgi:hypothetical protein
MKLRSKILVGAGICVITPALFLAADGAKKRHDVERTRRQLQAEGFKTELSQIDTNYAPEAIARGQKVLEVDLPMDSIFVTDIRAPVYQSAGMFRMERSNSVVVAWKEEFYSGAKKRSPWPAIHQTLEKRRVALDKAVGALMEGPVAFPNNFSEDQPKMYSLDYLPEAAKAVGVNVLCNLYYGRRTDAWTNLVALTRLVSQAETGPRNRRSLVGLVPLVYTVTWQAFQDSGWSDQQLVALEAEWSRVDFLKSIPDSVACMRGLLGRDFENLRHPKPNTNENSDITLNDLLKSPKMIPSVIKQSASMTWYRWANSYDDERNSLIFLRDREIDLHLASQAASVVEMLRLPSITNPPSLDSKHFITYPASIRIDYEFFATRFPGGGGRFSRAFMGNLACAADSEIRRRIVLTALALERFRLGNSKYPEKLTELTNVAPNTLIDFADGQPLRYRRTEDGHFLLYSIGLDCIDNGGIGAVTNGYVGPVRTGAAQPQNTDIIWPIPTQFPKARAPEPEE